jgi:FkbM family methyltransferase
MIINYDKKIMKKLILLPFYIIFYLGEAYSIFLRVIKNKYYSKWYDLCNREIDKKFLDINHLSIERKKINLKFYTPNSRCKGRVETFSVNEPETLAWIDRQKAGGIFFDVGSNIGLFSIYYAKSKEGKVYSFEPSVYNILQLAKNINLNNLKENIFVIKNPLSEKNQISNLTFNKLDQGGSEVFFGQKIAKSLIETKYNMNHEFSYNSLGLSVDFLVESKMIEIPDCIKMDVDGTEELIIEGAKKTLSNHKVKSLLIEVNNILDNSTNKIEKNLKELGFIKSDFKNPKNANQIWDR